MSDGKQKMISTANGMLFKAGYKLEKAGENVYQIVNRFSGAVIASGDLATMYYTSYTVAGKHSIPAADREAANNDSYKAGLEMSKKLNGGKKNG